MKKSIIFFLITSIVILLACKTVQGVEDSAQPPTEQSDTVGIANPASVYCQDQGFTLELRTQEDGGVYGVCIFPDGSECEEWAYFHQECSPGTNAGASIPDSEQPSTSPTDEPVFQPAVPEGWQTFTNPRYGYQVSYPADAVVEWSGVMGVPTDEIPQDMTVDQYMAQLESTLGDNICVIIKYSLGYINILPNWKENVKYNPCGRTGVGVGEMEDKTEQVMVNGQMYTAEGFEWLGGGDMLDQHNETMIIFLSDGTRVEYGASPHSDASYQDYLNSTKDTLISIINTLQTTP